MTRRVHADDWRRQGQEQYMKNISLQWTSYAKIEDHDHCEFCGVEFSLADGLRTGYSTEDGYRWVCKDCFEDFKSEFNWSTE